MHKISTDDPQLLGKGIYGVAEAARLTGVSSECIRRWLRGYRYQTAEGERAAVPLFPSQLGRLDGELALSFLDLIEVKVVNSLRRQKISWRVIRLAERNARDLFQVDHPFATKTFKTDGRRIFADLKQQYGEQALLDLAEHQLTFRAVVEPHLKNIEFDDQRRAERWWPMGLRRHVLLDPKRSFGQPIVPQGVPTAVLARAFKVQKSLESVADWFEVERRAVRDAVDFENNLAAAA